MRIASGTLDFLQQDARLLKISAQGIAALLEESGEGAAGTTKDSIKNQ